MFVSQPSAPMKVADDGGTVGLWRELSNYAIVRFNTFSWNRPYESGVLIIIGRSFLEASRDWKVFLALSPSSRTVLLVEDEWLIRADLAAGLEEAGWDVLEARTGEGAIETLRNGGRIDLLVTDIQLAGCLSGWDVADVARKVRPDLPVLYVSGNHPNPSRQVDGSLFLSKPCNGFELANTAQALAQASNSNE